MLKMQQLYSWLYHPAFGLQPCCSAGLLLPYFTTMLSENAGVQCNARGPVQYKEVQESQYRRSVNTR